jgi:hypothetical protein
VVIIVAAVVAVEMVMGLVCSCGSYYSVGMIVMVVLLVVKTFLCSSSDLYSHYSYLESFVVEIIVLCPCALTGHHAMKAYWGSEGIAPLIL